MSGQWSYYMSRFRSAARLAPSKDVEIGGYIVGRTSGHRLVMMKTLAQVAGGAKNIRYYTFGPVRDVKYEFSPSPQPACLLRVSLSCSILLLETRKLKLRLCLTFIMAGV